MRLFRAMSEMDEVSSNANGALPVNPAWSSLRPLLPIATQEMQRVGVAADHGGFELKNFLVAKLRAAGHRVSDFGDLRSFSDDDYPDYIIPLAQAVARGDVERGVAVCGSGVGACITSNKVNGVRACLIYDNFSARQGVEDDDLNVICLGGLVVAPETAWVLVQTFLVARFSGAARHRRRLEKVAALEQAVAKGVL